MWLGLHYLQLTLANCHRRLFWRIQLNRVILSQRPGRVVFDKLGPLSPSTRFPLLSKLLVSTVSPHLIHCLTRTSVLLTGRFFLGVAGTLPHVLAQREVPWAAMGVHCSCYSFAKPPMYISFPNRNLACPDPSLNLRRRRRSRFDYLVQILESLKPFLLRRIPNYPPLIWTSFAPWLDIYEAKTSRVGQQKSFTRYDSSVPKS